MVTFAGMLQNRPKLNRLYNTLTPQAQQAAQQAFSQYGRRGAKQYIRGAVNMYPRPANQFNYNPPNLANRNQDTALGIQMGQGDANMYASRWNLGANRVAEQGPFMSRSFEQNPVTGQWTAGTTTNPAMQSRINAVQNYTAPQADANTRTRIENQIYNTWKGRNDPVFAQQWNDFRQQMANQGIPETSELYKRQATQLSQQQNDARQQAQSQATQMGGEEMQRQFNMQTQAANLPFQQMQSMAQTQGGFQAGFQPIYTEKMAPVDVETPGLQMYEWQKQEPQRQDWKMQLQALINSGQMDVAGLQAETQKEINEQDIAGQASTDLGPPEPPPPGDGTNPKLGNANLALFRNARQRNRAQNRQLRAGGMLTNSYYR